MATDARTKVKKLLQPLKLRNQKANSTKTALPLSSAVFIYS
jgi:hypothetical protein